MQLDAKWLAVALALVPVAVHAQQPGPVERAFQTALKAQQIGAEMQTIGADMQMQLRAAATRIEELEKLCGEPCKPKPKPKPEDEPK